MRLDLTYWVSIVMAITLLLVKNTLFNESAPLPSFTDIVLHMFYLQDLMQVETVISVVYWTLCLEVQFYLFYMFYCIGLNCDEF